jgi:hypothetical protein
MMESGSKPMMQLPTTNSSETLTVLPNTFDDRATLEKNPHQQLQWLGGIATIRSDKLGFYF